MPLFWNLAEVSASPMTDLTHSQILQKTRCLTGLNTGQLLG